MKRKFHNTEGEDDEHKENEVVSVENNIFFYCDVDRETVLKLNSLLTKTEIQIQTNKLAKKYDCINLYIMSNGGELHAGLSAMNFISNMNIHVNTIIDGHAASAATLIALGGHELWMQKHATLLIHQISTGFWGKYEECKDETKNNKLLMKILKNIYLSKTNIPKKVLKEYFQRDITLDADTCLQYNIVHGIF